MSIRLYLLTEQGLRFLPGGKFHFSIKTRNTICEKVETYLCMGYLEHILFFLRNYVIALLKTQITIKLLLFLLLSNGAVTKTVADATANNLEKI